MRESEESLNEKRIYQQQQSLFRAQKNFML